MSRLSKNIIYNLVGQGLLLALGFIAVKYVFHQLGEDALGIIYFTTTLSSVLYAALQMGIGPTVVREVSAHFRDERGYVSDLIRTASLLYWVAYALVGVALYAVAPFLVERWINLKTMDVSTATRMVQILGIASLLVLPRSLYGSLVCGLQRMEFTNLIEVLTVGLQRLGTVVILALGGSLFQVVYWFALCFFFGLLCYVIVSIYLFSFRDLIPDFSASIVRRNLRYSTGMMFVSILATVHSQADKLILSKLLPIGTFGIYGFANSTVSKLTLVGDAISQPVFPSFSYLFHKGNRGELMAQYRKFQDLVCFVTLPILASIPFVARPLLTYLFNVEIAQTLFLPVILLCIGSYMSSTLQIPVFFSLAAGKPRITVLLNFYALFAVLPVTVASVYFFGLTGAAMSWVVYHLFSYTYAVPRICSECLEMQAAEWYSHVLKISGLGGGTYGLAWTILESVGARSILFSILAYAVASFVFLVGAYLMTGNELRETFVRFLQALKLRVAEVL